MALFLSLAYMKYIPYYRVSTVRQGQSGLGLEAQKQSVLSFVGTNDIVAEFTDIESGKSDTRPELLKAIQLSKDTGATLLVAKLDRLSRNLTFISILQDTKVDFVAVDMPTADRFTISIFASLAQWERDKISERTKSALKALKDRGVKLGTPANLDVDARKKGNLKRKEQALSNGNNQKARMLIKLLSDNGKSLREIADTLNSSGFVTSTGKDFKRETVRRLQ